MKKNTIIIYQAKDGAIELRADYEAKTFWASQAQIARLFNVNPQAITKHLQNIYSEGELKENATCSKMEQVQMEGNRKIKRLAKVYNLDAIISVGYRINSSTGTKFRQWATKTLNAYISHGYVINKNQIKKHYQQFQIAINNIRLLQSINRSSEKLDILELIRAFASTWLSLEAYDNITLPKTGVTRRKVKLTTNELKNTLLEFNAKLRAQKGVSELFGQESNSGSIEGIMENIFQSFSGKELYPTIEEKAAHLLYFIVKDHPFIDGNKRSGAFAFIWLLRKANILDVSRLTPEALTALTILIAESKHTDKEKIIGIILQLLKKEL